MASAGPIDRTFLAAAGLGALSDEDQESLVDAIRDELETRVGTRLSAAMTAAELNEFTALQSAGDKAASIALLDRCVPWYPRANWEEAAVLGSLLTARSEEILASRKGRA